MSNMDQKIEAYLGDTAPEDFESADEIRDYFEYENLKAMFGEEPDMVEALDVMEATIKAWALETTDIDNIQGDEVCWTCGASFCECA